jgi:trimeric autotransporter adhesin
LLLLNIVRLLFQADVSPGVTQAISIDSINWTLGSSSCSTSDYTTDTAYLDAGGTYAMSVTNGDWCGCGVWIDFDNNMVFDSTENLFHLYTANQTNNYSFNISIPANVPTGIYRMRVIAGWGTDCYTVSGNGYGPCGSYQYRNFDDFTVSFNALTTNVSDLSNSTSITAFPNPVSDLLTVSIPNWEGGYARTKLTDITGKVMRDILITNNKQTLDVSDLTQGVYLLNYADNINSMTLKIVK